MNTFTPKDFVIPGLLTTSEMQERTKRSAAAGRQQATAVPPNSAVEFSDRVVSEYLDRTLQTEGLKNGGRGQYDFLTGFSFTDPPKQVSARDQQNERTDYRAGMIADALQNSTALRYGLLGPVGGAAAEGGALSEIGQLRDPAARQAEADKRAADAQAELDAARTAAETSDNLRKSAAGAQPFAPFGTPVETPDTIMPQEVAQQRVDVAAGKLEKAQAAVKDPRLQPTQTWWLDATQRFVRGATDVTIDAVTALPLAWDIASNALTSGDDRTANGARVALETVGASLEKMLPTDPTRAEDMKAMLAQGSGSMLAFMAAGYVASGLEAAGLGASGVLGAAAEATSQYKEAEQFGAGELQRLVTFFGGAALGTTEAIPIDRMLLRADRATGGGVRRLLRNTAAGSLEEFIQEAGQMFGEDALAKWQYDAERELSVERALKAGFVGAVSGGLAASAVSTLDRGALKPRVEPIAPETITAFVDGVMTEKQGELDRLREELVNRARLAMPTDGMVASAEANMAEGRGGPVPVNANGMVELTRWSDTAPETASAEQSPGGTARAVYSIGDVQNTDAPGAYRSTVEVAPDELYNAAADPLKLRGTIDATTSATEQMAAYEQAIKDAGFKGALFGGTEGQSVVMFEPRQPSRVTDERYGAPVSEIAQPAEFDNPTPATFAKRGWAVIPVGQGDTSAATVQALRDELTQRGIPFQETSDTNGDAAQGTSFVVFAPENVAAQLGQKYRIDGILTRRGVEYADGRVVPLDGVATGDAARAQGVFSTLPSGQVFAANLKPDAIRAGLDPSVGTGTSGSSQSDAALEELFPMPSGGTASGRAPFKAEPGRPQQGVSGDAATDLSLGRISANLVDLLDLTVRQGRLTVKGGAVGQYSRKQDVVRLRTVNDFSTLAHEAGHALHMSGNKALSDFADANRIALGRVAMDLYGADIANETVERKTSEGMAELVRIYITNKAYADTHYGALSTGLDELLRQNLPELHAGLNAVRDQFQAWLQLPSAALVRNMVVSTKQDGAFAAAVKELQDAGFENWFHQYARRTVEQSLNRFAAVDDLVAQLLNVGQDNLGAAIDLKRADDPRVLIKLAANSGARAMVEMTDGVMGHRSMVPVTRGLRDALYLSQGWRTDGRGGKMDEVRKQDFAAYLVALRGIDEYARMANGQVKRPPVNATLGDLRQAVAEMDAKYGPGFAEAAQIVHDYGMGLWQKAYDAGMIAHETYVDGKSRNFYAPLQRDMSDKKGKLGGNVLTDGKQSIVKRFRGSDRNILDPMEVLMHKTYALERAIAENEVKKALGALADKAGRAGALVERIPARQLLGQQFSVADVARQLTQDDTITEADAADLMTLLGPSMVNDNFVTLFASEPASAAGENILFYWDKGKLQALQLNNDELGADVVQAMGLFGPEKFPMFTDLVAAPSTLFRAAVTSWPDFLLVNFVRDQFSAWILTDVGFRPFASGLKGAVSEVRQNDIARRYNAAMGIMGGMNTAALHDTRVNHDLAALRAKGYVTKAFSGDGLTGKARGLANIVELTETGTRLGIFEAAYNRARSEGLSDWEASVEAGYTATDYMNFGLHGSRMLLLKRTIPFLGAQLNGLYKMMRTLGADEVRQRKGLRFALASYFKSLDGLDLSRTEKAAIQTGRRAWVKMSILALLSSAMYAAFKDDPDYQDASEYLRATGWVIPTGDGTILYVPKPFELAMLANITERGLEMANGDAAAGDRLLRGIAMNLSPPVAPPAIQLLVEEAANRDFFSGTDIVPDYMAGLAPELQYNSRTSELAKAIGERMGWSPLRVEHVLSGMGASAYRDITAVTNAMSKSRPGLSATDTPVLRRFVRDARSGATSTRDFWRLASSMDGALRRAELSYRNYLDAGKEQEAEAYLRTLDTDEQAYAILMAHFKTDAKRLHPLYRARQVSTVVSKLRRELTSDLGVDDTTMQLTERIQITASRKKAIDTVLSEIVRRELRNGLVTIGAPGWEAGRRMPVAPTYELLQATSPEIADELERRLAKAKVYDEEAVAEAWPDLKNRLLTDRENAILSDLVAVAGAGR